MHEHTRLLHIVEPGGQGGVYQHVLGAIQNAQYSQFEAIVVHTAKDAEATPYLHAVRYCHCMRYQRKGPRPLRASVSLGWSLLCLLPHLGICIVRSKAHWEIQGLFGKFIYAWIVFVCILLRRDVTFVPHNSFSRSGDTLEKWAMDFSASIASRVVIFVDSEKHNFPTARSITKRTLWQYVAALSAATVQQWDRRLGPDFRPRLLFIGQLRMDKNPTMLIDAANEIDSPLTLVFAGQDKGAGHSIASWPLRSLHDRVMIKDYLSIEDFQALMSVSDILVCPYSIASQSGVVALARQLDKTVVASNTGGLAEQTPYVFEIADDDAHLNLAAVLVELLRQD